MKIVTVCENGNKRSVHAAFLMRWRRKVDGGGTNDVIPIGIKTSSPELQKMLFDWCEWIILTDISLKNLIAPEYHSKLHIWNIGPDIWPSNLNKDILDKLRVCMEKEYNG